jgi:hypothetical protein
MCVLERLPWPLSSCIAILHVPLTHRILPYTFCLDFFSHPFWNWQRVRNKALKKDVAELALLPHFKKFNHVDRQNKNVGKN